MKALAPVTAVTVLAASAVAGPVARFSAAGITTINGEFRAIARGEGAEVLVRLDGSLVIPPGPSGAQNMPPGPYLSADCGGENAAHAWVVGLRADGTLAAAGYDAGGTLAVPPGQFVAVAAGARHGIALRADGTLAGWGSPGPGPPPAGVYRAIAAGDYVGFAIREDRTIAIWGSTAPALAAVPPGEFVAVSSAITHAVAIRTDGTLVAWGLDRYGTGVLNVPGGTFTAVDTGPYFDAAIRTDGSIAVWGGSGLGGGTPPAPPPGSFRAVRVSASGAIALAESCYPNCDSSSTPPILNILDFNCFVGQFAAGSPAANCDNSTVPPLLNVLDFSCFLSAFAAGCAP